MNDEFIRMPDQQEQLRRLADRSTGLGNAIRAFFTSASFYESFRLQGEYERRTLIEMATG